MKKLQEKYFLAANSSEGFISSFKENYDPLIGFKAYIIKGGPGTGKSSFMKRIAEKAESKGLRTILCPCSSDPDSLDAVIIPERKFFIADGTAPHVMDPDFPAVCETILNFGEYWDSDILDPDANEIIALTRNNKQLHKTASEYIKGAAPFLKENFYTDSLALDRKKATRFAENLCKKYIPVTKAKPKEWVRYLTSPSPKGIAFLGDWLSGIETLIPIQDQSGAVSTFIFDKIRQTALNCGHEIVTIKSGLLPSLILDGVIIPSLDLAFVRDSKFTPLKTDVRRIHAERFLEKNTSLRKQRSNLKTADILLGEAVATLHEAKLNHDSLEAFYITAMDFNRLEKFADNFCESFLK